MQTDEILFECQATQITSQIPIPGYCKISKSSLNFTSLLQSNSITFTASTRIQKTSYLLNHGIKINDIYFLFLNRDFVYDLIKNSIKSFCIDVCKCELDLMKRISEFKINGNMSQVFNKLYSDDQEYQDKFTDFLKNLGNSDFKFSKWENEIESIANNSIIIDDENASSSSSSILETIFPVVDPLKSRSLQDLKVTAKLEGEKREGKKDIQKAIDKNAGKQDIKKEIKRQDLKQIPSVGQTKRTSYISTTNNALARKVETKTECTITCVTEKRICISTRTRTPNVPNGSMFEISSVFRLEQIEESVSVQVYLVVEWSGTSWIKSLIENGVEEGLKDYYVKVCRWLSDKVEALEPETIKETTEGTAARMLLVYLIVFLVYHYVLIRVIEERVIQRLPKQGK